MGEESLTALQSAAISRNLETAICDAEALAVSKLKKIAGCFVCTSGRMELRLLSRGSRVLDFYFGDFL